jgi:hypothetical protein
MELDILQEKWAEQDRKLDSSIRLNQRLLMAVERRRWQSPLRIFALLTGIGVFVALAILEILGRFIYTHRAEPRYALPAIILHVWVIAYAATSIRQIAMALQIDYDKPIVTIQRQIETLRALRLRALRWGLLTGQLVWWIPFLVVVLKGAGNIDAYQAFGMPFLTVNLALGAALIPAAVWLSRKFGDRMAGSPAVQRLMRELAGYNINAASRFLATLAEFEREAH